MKIDGNSGVVTSVVGAVPVHDHLSRARARGDQHTQRRGRIKFSLCSEKREALFDDDPFFQNQIGVQGGFAGGDDGVGLAGAFVELEAFDFFQLRSAVIVLMNQFAIGLPDGGLGCLIVDGVHQAGGLIDERIEGEEREQGGEDFRDAVTIEADDTLGVGVGGEVAVGEDDVVAMSHFHQNVHQVGGDDGRNSIEHAVHPGCGYVTGVVCAGTDFDNSKSRIKGARESDYHYAEILRRRRGWLAGYAAVIPL